LDGVPREWTNTTYWVEFDPEVRGRMWGAMSYTHDLPRPKMWRRTSVLSYKGGVCRSEDGGQTWPANNAGIAQKEPFAWRLAQAADGILYVLLARRGQHGSIGDAADGAVYKSVDGAETRSRVGLPTLQRAACDPAENVPVPSLHGRGSTARRLCSTRLS
jgi:hypothetical protein